MRPFDVRAPRRIRRLASIFNALPVGDPPRSPVGFTPGYGDTPVWITMTFLASSGESPVSVSYAQIRGTLVLVTADGYRQPDRHWGTANLYAEVDAVLRHRLARLTPEPGD